MMSFYNDKKVEEIVKALLGRRFRVMPIGNHELERHLVYKLKDENGTNLILKLYFRKNRWNREVAALKQLSSSGVTCPELIGYGVLEDGTEWLVTEFIDGEAFFKVKNIIDRRNRVIIYRQMGEEIGKMHGFKTFEFFGNWDHNCNSMDCTNNFSAVFIRRAEITIENLLERRLPEYSLYKIAAKKLRDNYGLIDSVKTACLCHNDYDERNVLVNRVDSREWRLVGVVDFEQSLPWDKDRDIVDLYYALGQEDEELVMAFLSGYNRFSSIGDEFYRKMDFYLLYSGINICSWAYELAPEYYERGIELLEKFVHRL